MQKPIKLTGGQLRRLVEDAFNYTGKGSERPVVGPEDARLKRVKASINMLKLTVQKLDDAARDNDEDALPGLLDRVKQFAKAAEAGLYGS